MVYCSLRRAEHIGFLVCNAVQVEPVGSVCSVYTVTEIHSGEGLHDRVVRPSSYHIGLSDVHSGRYLGVTRARPDTDTCWLWETNHPLLLGS